MNILFLTSTSTLFLLVERFYILKQPIKIDKCYLIHRVNITTKIDQFSRAKILGKWSKKLYGSIFLENLVGIAS